MGKIRDFFRPQRLGFHLVLAVVITLLLMLVAAWVLKAYTQHGKEVEMPNYIGMNGNDLMNETPADFVFVVRNTIYAKDKPEGTVVEQDPILGENVKKHRKVYLTLSSPVPPTVEMPQLAGDITLRQAITILEDSGLELDKVIYTQSENVNLVLEQYYKGRPIKSGTKLNQGAKITLEVGADVRDIDAEGDIPVDDLAPDPNDESSGENFYYNN